MTRGAVVTPMQTFNQWLMHEDQRHVWDSLYATFLTAVFVAFGALVLWPMGKTGMSWSLLKGLGIFWFAIPLTAIPLLWFQRIFRVDLYSHYDAYVISGIAVSGILQAGWSAFAALTARDYAAGTSIGVTAALYVIGFLSCQVACAALAPYYGGQIYRYANVTLAAVAFVIFALLPAAARFLYGWFFDLILRLTPSS